MSSDQQRNFEVQYEREYQREREERVKKFLREFTFLDEIRDRYYPKLQIFDIHIREAISEVSACKTLLEDRQDIDTGIGDGETYITKSYIVNDDGIHEYSEMTDLEISEHSLLATYLVIAEEGTRWSEWPDYVWKYIVMYV